MLRRLANDAMRSDQRAIKLLLSLVDRYGESPQTTLQLRAMLDEDQEILAQYLREPDDFISDTASTPDDESGEHGS